MPIPTTMEAVSLPDGAQLVGIDWPEPVPVTVRYTGEPVALLSYTETVHIPVQIRRPPDGLAAGAAAELRVSYQACDEQVCYPPKTVRLRVRLE